MSTPFNKTIGCNVRFLRQEHGMRIDELASLAFMSVGTLSNIENANRKRDVDRNYIEQIARALNVSPESLMEEDPVFIKRISEVRQLLSNNNYSEKTFQAIDRLLRDTASRGPRDRVNALMIRGTLDYRLGDYVSAREFFDHALSYAVTSSDETLIHKARYNLATTFLQTGDLNSALSLVSEDLKHTGEAEFSFRNYYLLAIIYQKQRKFEEAEKNYLSSVRRLSGKEHTHQAFLAKCYQSLGDLYRMMSRFDESSSTSEIALQMANEVNDDIAEIYARRTIILAAIDQGRRENVLEELNSVIKKIESCPYISRLELLKTEFYLQWCKNHYSSLTPLLKEIEGFEIDPRELAIFYEKTAELAMEWGKVSESQELYKKAIRILLQ